MTQHVEQPRRGKKKRVAKAQPFFKTRRLPLLILCFLFATAFCLRLYGIDNPPLDANITRQYHSALLARGFYEWLLVGELETYPQDGILEPPVLELVASFAYHIAGGEYLWIPRLLSTIFWMIGGVFLYLIAKRVVSPNAGLFSVFFYLFVPWSIFTSRAFMPDPLMVMLLLSSVLALLRYHEQPSTRRLLIAAVASSLAVFVKPVMCLFQIFGAFVSLAVYRQGVRRSLTSSHVLGFMVLSVLPTALYYLYGTFVAGFLQTTNTFTYRIVPHLLLEATFWVGWGETIAKVVGYSALAGALLGVLLLRRGVPRALMVGLWGGYLLFGLVFTTHISTHDYYSLQLIPVIALSLGPIWELVTSRPHWAVSSTRTGRGGLRKYTWGVVPALLVSALILGVVVENRQTILKIVEQERYAEERWAPRIATYQEIGQVVNHSRHTLVLVHWDYGNSLAYHGRLAKKAWPPPAQLQVEERLGRGRRSVEKRFDALSSEHPPEYFIITKNWYWDAEYQDLRGFLTKNFTLMAQGDDYVVFDLRDKG